MRKINNRQKRSFAAQKLIHRDGLHPRDPVARLLPQFAQRIVRPRTRYTRKGRQREAGNGWQSQLDAQQLR